MERDDIGQRGWKGSKNRKVGGGRETNNDKEGLERKTRLFGWVYNQVMQQIDFGVKVIIAFTLTGTGLESNLSSFGVPLSQYLTLGLQYTTD